MLNFSKICNYNNSIEISFDLKKNVANLAKHGLSLADAEFIEWDTVLAMPDVRRDYDELREIGYGLLRRLCTTRSIASRHKLVEG